MHLFKELIDSSGMQGGEDLKMYSLWGQLCGIIKKYEAVQYWFTSNIDRWAGEVMYAHRRDHINMNLPDSIFKHIPINI